MPISPAAETSIRDVLVKKLCRLTAIDKIAIGFGAAFLFLFAALALTAHIAVGEAPEGRLWGFLFGWASIGFAFGVAGPWALCRTLHAAAHAGRLTWDRRAALMGDTQSLTTLFQGRTA